VFRLAVHRAGTGERRSSSACWRRSPIIRCGDLRELSRRMGRNCSAPRPAAASRTLRFLAQSGQQRRPMDHQRARSEQQGVRLTGSRVPVRSGTQFKERIRGPRGHPREGAGCSNRCAVLLDQPPLDQDTFYVTTTLTPARVRNSSPPGDCVFFGNFRAISGFGELRILRQPGTGAVSQAHRTAVLLACDGDAGGRREPAVLPFRRVQKDVLSGVGAGFLL